MAVATASVKPALPEFFYPANVLTELRLAAIPFILAAVVLRHPAWALGIFVGAAFSDGFDGWVARRFNQRSSLGLYLDPLADKLLVTTLFVALAIIAAIPWPVTLIVLIRDACILTSAAVLYFGTGFRDFRPTWWGKASTTAELATVAVALYQSWAPGRFADGLERFGWFAVVFLALVSGIHYAFASARRYHAQRA